MAIIKNYIFADEHTEDIRLHYARHGCRDYNTDNPINVTNPVRKHCKNRSYAALKKYIADALTLGTAEAAAEAKAAFSSEVEYYKKLLAAVKSGANFTESFNALMRVIFDTLQVPKHKQGSAFADYTGLSDVIFRNLRNSAPAYCPEHKKIIAVCAGFDLDISIAENLLLAGAKSLGLPDEHIAYRLILTACRGWAMSERNDYLEVLGYGRLSDY